MIIQKYIDISQEIEINITAADIRVILDEPQTDEEETQAVIHSNLSNCITYLASLTEKQIAKTSSGARAIVVEKLNEISHRFATVNKV